MPMGGLTDDNSSHNTTCNTNRMLLPAFPVKSPNPDKVIGTAPDFCEFTAVLKLYDFCKKIGQLYEPGVRLTLLSDYHTFGSLIGVDAAAHNQYREQLRGIVGEIQQDGEDYISITGLGDFPEFEGRKERDFQEILRQKHGDRDFEASVSTSETIKNKLKSCQDENNLAFVQDFSGLRAFMQQDQKYILQRQGLGEGDAYRRRSDELAAGMMVMGKALTAFLSEHYPADQHLRLNIHNHPFDGKKFAILLLPVHVRINKKNKNSSSITSF